MEKETAIDFNIVPASNCPERNAEAKPMRVDMSIAIMLFHLLERFAPIIKRMIKGAITPINPDSHCGCIFILSPLILNFLFLAIYYKKGVQEHFTPAPKEERMLWN
jgi:hypothetical protein